jgi:hypothetical protein
LEPDFGQGCAETRTTRADLHGEWTASSVISS